MITMDQNSHTDAQGAVDYENQIVSWINQLDFAIPTKKITLIRQITEILLHQCPQVLSIYLDDILCFINDRSQDIKKILVSFIEEVSKLKIELLPRMVSALQMLLMDTIIPVQKRVIQAANTVYRNAFIWICSSPIYNEDMEKAWEMLSHIKLIILNMVDCDNEGIRTNSIKFLEGIIKLQTYRDETAENQIGDYALDDIPLTVEFIEKKKLEEESSHIFNLLLKFHNSQHISGVNLMACMSALCEIAKARPKFLPKVIQAFGSLNSILPPTLSQSQANSVRKHLKMQIINLIRHPSSSDVLQQLLQMLSDLGMTFQEISKIVPKGERKHKRVNDLRNGESMKRSRIDSPQSNSQSSDKSDISAHFDAGNEEMDTVDVGKQLLEGLQNIDCVVNLVMASMSNLPDEMPKHFKTLYEPISNAGVMVQHTSIAKLLLHAIKNDSSDGTQNENNKSDNDEDERIKLKNALAKLESSKLESKIESVIFKMMEENKEESARDKEIIGNFDKEKEREKVVCPPTPTIPKLIQRAKTIKLNELTKPLSQNIKEKLILSAVERVLRAENACQNEAATTCRMKMLSTFAVSFSDEVRQNIMTFILDDVVFRIDLALSWMYEEYCYMQGFSRKIVVGTNPSKIDEKSFQNYNNLMCGLLTDIMQLSDPSQEILREKLFRKVYLESPLVTGDALKYLTSVCTDEEKSALGLNLLKDLILYHPTKSLKYMSAMLPLTVDKNSVIREAAIEKVVEIYKSHSESLKKIVDKFANLHLGFAALSDPPKDILDFNSDSIGFCTGLWDDELYKLCIQLYLAILPYNHELLHELCRIYVGINADAKRCVLRLLEAPIRLMGSNNETILSIIEECPKGAETLVTRIIYILTEKVPPTEDLVNRVRELYAKKVPDVRFIIPVINGLTKSEFLNALPKLIKLNPLVVKEAFNKIWTARSLDGTNNYQPVSPAELLIALHIIDTSKVELKYIIKATSLCFGEKQVYTSEVLCEVLQNLVDQPQLPVVLMRSVLQALSIYPTRLSSFVITILEQLIFKQVWEYKVVWEGFLKCCQRLLPQSLKVITTLPAEPLRLAFKSCPDLYTTLFHNISSISNVPDHVSEVMSEFSSLVESSPSGTESSFNHAIDTIDITMQNEPLPPGME